MLHVKNILVPRDFSTGSEQALVYAADLARRTGAALHLLFVDVLYQDVYTPVPVSTGTPEGLEERLLVGVDQDVPLHHAVERDVAAAPPILSYAEEKDVDLIVMGTHGRRGLRRLLLGSVAEEVVRLAPCPVLTVRGHEDEDAVTIKEGAALLVPTDFSDHARLALAHAREWAALYGARIDLLHVIEEQLHPAFYNVGVTSIYDLQPDIEEKAAQELKQFFEKSEGPSVPVAYHVRHGHAAREIVAFAAESRSSLVVMATHGLRGLQHFLLGSVADKVVRRAPAPVLTIKGFGKSLLSTAAVGGQPAGEPWD